MRIIVGTGAETGEVVIREESTIVGEVQGRLTVTDGASACLFAHAHKDVFVGPGARLTVCGTVDGDIYAFGLVELHGEVRGAVHRRNGGDVIVGNGSAPCDVDGEATAMPAAVPSAR